jgi:hypothetical protein
MVEDGRVMEERSARRRRDETQRLAATGTRREVAENADATQSPQH